MGATNSIASSRISTRTECPGNRPRKRYRELPSTVLGTAGPNPDFRTGKRRADRGEKFDHYSFIVRPATKVVVGSQKAKIEDLVGLKEKSVTVKYRAERKGNKAIEIVAP